MSDFREKVKKLRKEKTNQFFTNGGTERSLITLTEIFKGAETNICIFAETLSDLSSGTTKNPATEEQYREELCAFLNRGVDAWGLNKLSVQEIEDKWASSTPLLRILIKEEYNGKDVAETFRHTRLAVRIKEEIEKQKNKIETQLKKIEERELKRNLKEILPTLFLEEIKGENLKEGLKEFLKTKLEEIKGENLKKGLKKFLETNLEKIKGEDLKKYLEEFLKTKFEEIKGEDLKEELEEFLKPKLEEIKGEDLKEELEEFLKPKLEEIKDEDSISRLEEIINKNKELESKVARLIDCIFQKLCCVKTTSKIVKMDISGDKLAVNFTIADNKMMRVEYDLEYRLALCNFNAKDEGPNLQRIYDTIWDNTQVIELY